MLMMQLILVQVATFVALVLVLKKLLYSETGKALRRLQWLNRENETKAQELCNKMQKAERECQQKIRQAEEEIMRFKNVAKTETEHLRAKILEGAKKDSEKIIAQAEKIKDDMRSEIAVEMDVKALYFGCELLQKIFDEEVLNYIHNRLITQIIIAIEKLDFEQVEQGVSCVEVFSPYPLGSKGQELKGIFSLKTKREINLVEKIDEKLIAGIVVKIGNLLLDGSISNKLEEARQDLKRSIG